MGKAINIIFDGPPSHQSGRFVEVETDDGKSISAGEWIERKDGLWALRITELPPANKSGNQTSDCKISAKKDGLWLSTPEIDGKEYCIKLSSSQPFINEIWQNLWRRHPTKETGAT